MKCMKETGEMIILWMSKKSLDMWILTEFYSLKRDVSRFLCKIITFHFIEDLSSWRGWNIEGWEWTTEEVVMLSEHHPIGWES